MSAAQGAAGRRVCARVCMRVRLSHWWSTGPKKKKKREIIRTPKKKKSFSFVYFSNNYSHSATRRMRNHDHGDCFIHCGRISCSSRLSQVESRLYPLQLHLKAKEGAWAPTDTATGQWAARDGAGSHARCQTDSPRRRRRRRCCGQSDSAAAGKLVGLWEPGQWLSDCEVRF